VLLGGTVQKVVGCGMEKAHQPNALLRPVHGWCGTVPRRRAGLGVGIVLGVMAALMGACAGPQAAPSAARAEMVLCTIKSGPTSGSGSREARAEMFKGHMANIQRLADEKRLVIAGPFSEPTDKTWRGLFVFDVSEIAAARSLAASDPGFIAGEFVGDFQRLDASPTLRQALEIEARREATAARVPGEPPPAIRAYVLITATDGERARRAIAKTPAVGRIVWAGRFVDRPGSEVLVVDAQKVADVRAALAQADPGPCVIDGWWSTVSLMDLPAAAGR
jgi:uncharacterized protein YciI